MKKLLALVVCVFAVAAAVIALSQSASAASATSVTGVDVAGHIPCWSDYLRNTYSPKLRCRKELAYEEESNTDSLRGGSLCRSGNHSCNGC